VRACHPKQHVGRKCAAPASIQRQFKDNGSSSHTSACQRLQHVAKAPASSQHAKGSIAQQMYQPHLSMSKAKRSRLLIQKYTTRCSISRSCCSSTMFCLQLWHNRHACGRGRACCSAAYLLQLGQLRAEAVRHAVCEEVPNQFHPPGNHRASSPATGIACI